MELNEDFTREMAEAKSQSQKTYSALLVMFQSLEFRPSNLGLKGWMLLSGTKIFLLHSHVSVLRV